MAKVTREQLNKWNEGAGNGFKVDLQMLMFHGEKVLEYVGEERADKTHFVVSMRFVDEAIGKGWMAKRTGKQLLTVKVARYIPITDDGLCQVDFGVYEEVIGEPQNRKMFSYMQKMSHKVNLAEILEKAEKARPIEGESAKDIEPQNIMDFIEEKTNEQEESEEMKENIVDEEMEIYEGMTFENAQGKVFVVTRLSEMSVDLNNGEQSIYDFGTSRTVGAILEALGKGSKLLDDNAQKPEEVQPEEITAEPETAADEEIKGLFYYTVTNENGETVGAGKVNTNCDDAVRKAREEAERYISDTGISAKYCAGGCKTPIAKDAREFLKKKAAKPETTADSEEPAKVEEISTEETETTEEPAVTAAAFPDMFAELAKAYITGKQAPKKPHAATETAKTEEQPQETEEPQEEPEKEPEPIGYHGEASDILTAEEVEKLTSGEQVHKGEKWAKRTYICTPYTAGSYLVYTISGENIEPGRDAKYAGFIANGAYYQDMEVIRAKLADDIDRELKERIPTEEAAKAIFETLEPDSYERRNIDSYLTYDRTREAQNLFFDDKKPNLRLYGAERNISTAEIIHYILDAENTIKDMATAYTESHKAEIYKNWIDYTRTAAKYAEILADKGSETHTLKKISKSIGDQKTVRILLVNGNEIKVDANAVKHISSWGYISDYSVQASDRQYIDRNEYGRAKDITAADIKQITHGGRILYSAA